MKVNNWWVQRGLLTTVDDASIHLSGAANQFPDEYVPMLFMTGDGHRHPPFQWTGRNNWSDIFDEFVTSNKMCCHVETYSDQVTNRAVPRHLQRVHFNNKVFGWEPEVFRTIQQILEDIQPMRLVLADDQPIPLSDIRHITSAMWRVHDHGFLRTEGATAMRFWDAARRLRRDPVSGANLPGFERFLRTYAQSAMQARTRRNDAIGAIIQKNVDRYPDHIHLITCGDAHLIHNALHNYVTPPVGTFGVSDRNSA